MVGGCEVYIYIILRRCDDSWGGREHLFFLFVCRFFVFGCSSLVKAGYSHQFVMFGYERCAVPVNAREPVHKICILHRLNFEKT